MSMLPLLLIFAVMLIPMFLMSRSQRKAQAAQREMISKLGVGDEVRTASGFYGLIVEEIGDDVILEAEDGSQLKWARAAIATRVEDPAAAGTAEIVETTETTETVRTADSPADGVHAAAYDAAEPTDADRAQAADESSLARDADRPLAEGEIPGVTAQRETR